MSRWPKRCAVALVAVGLTVAVAACGSSSDNGGTASGGTVTIGVVLPLSGTSATVGQSAKAGITDAVNYINAHGGIKSMGGAKLALDIADHHGDKDAGRAAALKLIDQDKVNLMLGSANSDTSLVVAQTCALRSIPCVSTDAAQAIVSNGQGWMFRPLPTMAGYVKSLVSAYQSFGAPATAKIAAVVSQGDLGNAVLAAAESSAKGAGWSYVGGVSYPSSTTNFLPIAQKLKSENPDAVIGLSYGEAAAVKKAFDEADFHPVILGVSSGWAGTPLIETLKDQSNGIFAAAGFDSDLVSASPELQAMSDAHVKATGSIPDTNYWIFNGAGFVIANALEAAGSSAPDKVKIALGQVKMKFADPNLPIVGGVDMENGENAAAAPPVLEVQNQKQVTVWPADVARGKVDTSGFPKA